MEESFTQGDPCTTTNFGFTNRLIVVEDDVDLSVTFGFNSCDEVCTPPPGANVEFCVDIGCIMPTGTVNVFGVFPNAVFNPFANPMTQQDEGSSIYCTTVFLEPGDTEFKFIINPGMGASEVNEQFQVGDPCTVSCCDGQFTNRVLTVEDGVDQSGAYVFNVPCESVREEEPVLDFPALDALCGGEFTITLTGGATPAGGVYSGTGVTDNGDGLTFDVDLSALAADEYTITYTITEALACVYTATSTLTVLDCSFLVTDPCNCNDDASVIVYNAAAGTYTNPNDGTFGEVVALTGLMGAPLPAGLDVRVVAVTGAIGVAVGDVLTYDANMYYSIAFDHADDLGYSMTVDLFVRGQALGYNLVIANTCAYPNPVFDPALDAIYCDFEAAVALGGFDPADILGPANAPTFTINGAPAMAFNPTTLGAGTYNVVMTYTGADDGNEGLAPDGGAAYVGCTQEVATTIIVRPLQAACVSNLNVTLGPTCSAKITPEMVLRGEFACADQINVTVDGGAGNIISGCGPHTYSVDIIVAGEIVYTCWGNILAEDKTDPVVVCPAPVSSITRDYAAQVATGTLAATDPLLNLNNYSCFTDIALPGNHNYDLVTFTTPNSPIPSDVFTLLLETAFADGNMVLFQGAFNPANPCENVIGSDDDSFVPGANPFDPALRLSLALRPNTFYTVMVTNYSPAGLGNWRLSIYSDNNTQVGGGNFAATTVTDTRDLVCDDINGIRFTSPRNWIVNADGTLDATATRNTFFGGSQTALNEFLAKLSLTGVPVATDNCGQVLVTLSDAVSTAGDCGNVTLTRTITVRDRYNSACTGTPRTDVCTQVITFRKPTIDDVVFPPFTVAIECDEDFAVDANGNVHPSVAGYPWIRTALGFHDLAQSYCNVGASYSDEPRIEVCEGTYKFRREWNLIDWCNPGSSLILNQLVKVGDFTGPALSGVPATAIVSTSPFACVANYAIPVPVVSDGNGCSTAGPTTYTITQGGVYVANGNIIGAPIVQLPIGVYTVTLCAADACGNETCQDYEVTVRDLIQPTASCDDQLNVSIGGGDVANGIEGIARIFAADVDEGSNDNCGPVTVEVRRNFWRNNTCDASASRFSPWGDFVDFYCCDIAKEITIELRVTDQAGNQNICWLVITPEDKLNPFCYAPAPVTLTCAALPLTFPGNITEAYANDFAATSSMMSLLFGGARGTDNCAVDTIVERTPNLQVNECGWGTITRRFEAWQLRPTGDANGNGAIDINEVFRSTNSCSQLITITELHDFWIAFPEDTDADCADPTIPTIQTQTIGCDVLAINTGTPVRFSATGDECYKLSITYDVINWCVWDGEYTGYVLPRITEDDGEPLPVDRSVAANERPVVIYKNPGAGLLIDRDHETNGAANDQWFVAGGDDSSIPNATPTLPNYGRYIYTQFIKVYDATAPVVTVGEYGGPTALCPDLVPGQFGDAFGNCEAAVSIPFSVADDCELFDGAGNLVVSIVSATLDAFAVDANRDGVIKANEFVNDANVLANITDNGDGTYTFAGTFPIITSAMGDNIVHAIRVLFEDGCGNQVSRIIEFDVIDCKGPAPICINGLTVTLMPQPEGGCAMAIWASDFEASPIYDCTGQGPQTNNGLLRVIKYAIYRASDVEAAGEDFVPNPAQTGLVLNQDDDQSTVVYIYAFDEEGNYDYCETYVLVQEHVDCGTGTGTLSGVIATETNQTVEGVEVNINGGMVMSMTTNANGTFSFNLPVGGDYSVTPYLNANPLNGVTTFDLVLMSKHILGVTPLTSPYKRIAADVNRSQTITTLDMIQLRKLILNIDTEFANNTSWRFVDAAYAFPVATNPWFEAFPELINENNFVANLNANFVGVKIGDINGSAQANLLSGDDRTLNGQFNFEVANTSVKVGNVYTVAFTAAEVEGFQGTLALNGAELVDIVYGVATAENFGLRFADQGMITMSFNGEYTKDAVLFSLVIRATQDAELSNVLKVNSRYTVAEAYQNGNTLHVGINFSNGTVADAGFEIYQNTPNPFQANTLIGFNLPADAQATVTITDASGRVLTVVRGDYAAGYNHINVTKDMIQGATGVLTYTVTTGKFTATKTMVVVK